MCERETIARELILEYLSRGDEQTAQAASILQKCWDVTARIPPGYQRLESLFAEIPTEESPELMLNTGNVALGAGDYDIAIEKFSGFLEKCGGNNEILLKRCTALMKESNFEEAIPDLKSVTEAEPANGVAWSKLILALWSACRYEEARSTYDKAVTQCHDSALVDLSVLLGRVSSV